MGSTSSSYRRCHLYTWNPHSHISLVSPQGITHSAPPLPPHRHGHTIDPPSSPSPQLKPNTRVPGGPPSVPASPSGSPKQRHAYSLETSNARGTPKQLQLGQPGWSKWNGFKGLDCFAGPERAHPSNKVMKSTVEPVLSPQPNYPKLPDSSNVKLGLALRSQATQEV